MITRNKILFFQIPKSIVTALALLLLLCVEFPVMGMDNDRDPLKTNEDRSAMPISIKAAAGLWIPMTEISTQKGVPYQESLSADISYWYGLHTGLGFRHRYSHKEFPYGLTRQKFFYNFGSVYLDLRYDFLRKTQCKFGIALMPAFSFVMCKKYAMGDNILPSKNGATFVELTSGLFAYLPLSKWAEITFDVSVTLPLTTFSTSNPHQEYIEAHVEPYVTTGIGFRFKAHTIHVKER